jgi:hypothetical protein
MQRLYKTEFVHEYFIKFGVRNIPRSITFEITFGRLISDFEVWQNDKVATAKF